MEIEGSTRGPRGPKKGLSESGIHIKQVPNPRYLGRVGEKQESLFLD